jgi:CarD family transcriptional regulator
MNAVQESFSEGDWIVYPRHGLGKTLGFEKQVISKSEVEFIVVYFENDKMTLRIPLNKADELGVRSISDESAMKVALTALRGKTKIRRTMWAKREKDYKDKLNKGDMLSIAEVLRDLYRGADDPEQSYSERQLFEVALNRFLRELIAIKNIDLSDAKKKVEENLQKI